MRPLRLEFYLSYLARLVSTRTERRTVVGRVQAPDRNNTQGLKMTEDTTLPLLQHLQKIELSSLLR